MAVVSVVLVGLVMYLSGVLHERLRWVNNAHHNTPKRVLGLRYKVVQSRNPESWRKVESFRPLSPTFEDPVRQRGKR